MTYRYIKDLITRKIKFGNGFEKELQRIIELNNCSKEELYELKNLEFVKQYRNAFENSAFYKDFYQKHGLGLQSIRDLLDISKIPIVTKSDVKEFGEDFLTKSKFTSFKAYSSGTSGTPLKVYRDFASTIKENAYVHFFQNMHGYKLGDPVVSLRGNLDRKILSYHDKINNVLYMSSFHLKKDRIDEYYKIIKEFQPKVIRAYPSSMHILATELYKSGKELRIPIAFTSSEVLHNFQKEIIEKVLNTKIFDWYGNAERTVALGQCQDSLYRELPLYSHVEVENNHLITTSLINSAFPLIRYKVDDIIKLAPNCKEEFIVQAIEGRDDDYIVLKNGHRIGRLDLAFKKIKRLLAAQIIQKRKDEILVNLIPDKGFSRADLNAIEKNLRDLIGIECGILFENIESNQLIRTKKGKFNLVISKMNGM
ncbi:hypothetical protein L3049_06370 [Labilibaculum sp. DW002]|uniref:Uncharacterized protein n=1 Tax=Paralabilibaculum antarcticum TaxID=2912572 RepID=A0ABT5VTL2_9BACT|nr:hypothetical protein [Labilibaculum sp. DW002]MDE5417629.1 hypothetical protein [Labilibaculum sp. DW002]